MEVWKDVKGYEGLYQVSNYGRVKSVDRLVDYKSKGGRMFKRIVKGTILKPKGNPKYLGLTLSKNGQFTTVYVHRLVAEAFLPNPCNLPEVNHKDENPKNNRVENLEWCTKIENVRYGTGILRSACTRSKKIAQYTESGELVEIYPSLAEVERRTGWGSSNISKVAKGDGGRKRYGYIWRYVS